MENQTLVTIDHTVPRANQENVKSDSFLVREEGNRIFVEGSPLESKTVFYDLMSKKIK